MTPAWIEAYRRRMAVGAAPEIVAYAVLQARLTPSLERAAQFAASQSDGLLGRDLAGVAAADATGRAGWERFATEWSDLDESLPRAVSLLVAGIGSAQPARDDLLDRALDTALAGSRERVATFATAIRGPTTGIYAFGVMLPLAMVGLLPVAASAGVGVSPAAIAVLYDGLIPMGLLAASAWLAARRPAVARPPPIRSGLVSTRSPTRTTLLAVGVGATAGVAGYLVLPDWATWIVIPGVGIGSAATYWFGPIRDRRQVVDSIESGVPDAVSLVGHRLAAGEPLEAAIAIVGERLSGATADVFRDGTRVHRRLRVTVPESFTGPVGALSAYESPRTETAVSLLAAAARDGPAGGETLVQVSSYLRELDEVEREARRELARTTDTLRQTALVFGPAIAGVTVALATGMGSLGNGGEAVPVPALGVVVGVYVLALAVVLPSLAVVLKRGLDVSIVGYRVGIALFTSSLVYPGTFLAARTVVQV
ncbi:type II/IV secretion system transmembrane protein [Halanaeroarchaeum sulfurireducens]|uniref:Type II/IV secretion system transmembrane protein n=2 Tax=Halanaeroarchaeum sulfurireducens TaxID=1604004 RepID=A0A0F7P7A5_9EURY|nr:type II/IV secretion system transmembrane protein [Halanaeroarchaeum sulfurireducens]ALG81492.1 type II/IV secretion system transmembrane protein [Halanaeroarchaeum sulfurireducens]